MIIETDTQVLVVKVSYTEVNSKFRIGYLNCLFFPCSSGHKIQVARHVMVARALWMALKADIQED